MEKKREPVELDNGYYWVKILGGWYVAMYQSGNWYLMAQSRGISSEIAGKSFQEIDERPITREHGKD